MTKAQGSGVYDEFVDEKCHVEGTLMTEHFNIGTSPDRDNSTRGSFDNRTFCEIDVQTETTLSINAADINWTPTCTSFIVERKIDAASMSTLESAIFAQECDELPSAFDPQYETDTDDDEFENNVDLRGDEAEEETEDVVRNSECEEERGPFSPSQELLCSECKEEPPSSVSPMQE